MTCAWYFIYPNGCAKADNVSQRDVVFHYTKCHFLRINETVTNLAEICGIYLAMPDWFL